MYKNKKSVITAIVYVLAVAAIIIAAGNIQNVEPVVIAAEIVAISIVGLLIIMLLNRLNLTQLNMKDSEIAYREWAFNLILHNSGNIIAIIDDKTMKADFLSSTVESSLGVNISDAKKDIKFMFKGVLNKNTNQIYEVISTLPTGQHLEEELEIRNIITGERHWFIMHVMHNTFDELQGKYAMYFIDRTVGRVHEKQMQEMLEVARNANAVKSQFLANMSHVFRTPMNAIGGYITLLRNNKDNPEKIAEYTEKIEYAYEDMLSLVNDVLEMSKNESGETQLEINEFNLPNIVKEAIEGVEFTAKQNNLSIFAEKRHLIYNTFIGDQKKIKDIIKHLLLNAVKYTPKGGKIWITITGETSKLEEYQDIRIDVTDTGVGIEEKYLRTLFDPFSESINDSAERMKHKGMGIVITKNLVDLMGVSISAVSKVGEGSTFTVVLKLRAVKLKEDEDKIETIEIFNSTIEKKVEKPDFTNESQKKTTIRGMRLLVVEDNEINAEIVVEMLKLKGANCEQASDGVEATKKFAENVHGYYDIILMDLMMPNMDGYEATKTIRSMARPDAKTVPILAMSANAYPDDIEKCYRAGMDGHMAKPLELNVMEREILKTINRKIVQPEKN